MPLSLVYLLAVSLKRVFILPQKFSFPIISVGNIIAGGTGKTPLVAYLAGKFQNQQYQVAVLSSAAAVPEKKHSAINRRDELYMLKEKSPDIIIKPKSKAALSALEKECPDNKKIAVIDDGFQSCHIKKDIDIVMIDASNPFDNKVVLPAGLLREPLSSIKRADVFIITHPYMVTKTYLDKLAERLKKFNKPVYIMDYEISGIKNAAGRLSCEVIEKNVITGVAGIGNPLNFFSLLSGLNPHKIHALVYPDHFAYRDVDLKDIYQNFIKNKASYVITTEKDYIKMRNKQSLSSMPVFYLDIKSKIKNPYEKEDFDTCILSMLK